MWPMRWIITKDEFDVARLDAAECKYIDSRRIPTDLQLWIFDDAAIVTRAFGTLIQTLLTLSGDKYATYVVLVPDPVWYFHRKFNKFPAVRIDSGDTAETYLLALNEDPGDSPIDAVGTNWWECVIVPPSRSWFMHALRDDGDTGGHLWIPADWSSQVREGFPYGRPERDL
jgi:hypothetical protein